MCIVSNISDWGRRTWPDPQYIPTIVPSAVPMPYFGPSREEWEEFKKLLKQAAKLDEITGQPNCVDPKKQEWMKEIEKRLKRLEKNASQSFP